MPMNDAMERARSRLRFPTVNVALFLATVATTLFAGFLRSPLAEGPMTFRNVVAGGFPFAGSLIAILFTHEMGHFLLARRWGVQTTLPYFIPAPFGAGTFGAVIRMRSALPSRSAALEIGAAGPLAGFAVAFPLLLWGLAHSEVQVVTAAHAGSALESPFSLLRALAMHRPLLAGDSSLEFYGESALTVAARWLVHGSLGPGEDVMLHPVAFAAWLGLLVTTLNLVPLGQLDGGHVLYALLGRRRARAASRVVSAGLLLAGLFLSWNWLVWWLLTRAVVGLGHPPAMLEEPLDPARKAVALVSLALFAGTFIPVPVSF